jgi:hypothetical protein
MRSPGRRAPDGIRIVRAGMEWVLGRGHGALSEPTRSVCLTGPAIRRSGGQASLTERSGRKISCPSQAPSMPSRTIAPLLPGTGVEMDGTSQAGSLQRRTSVRTDQTHPVLPQNTRQPVEYSPEIGASSTGPLHACRGKQKRRTRGVRVYHDAPRTRIAPFPDGSSVPSGAYLRNRMTVSSKTVG